MAEGGMEVENSVCVLSVLVSFPIRNVSCLMFYFVYLVLDNQVRDRTSVFSLQRHSPIDYAPAPAHDVRYEDLGPVGMLKVKMEMSRKAFSPCEIKVIS